MVYAGLGKRENSHFENCNNNPEETHVQGDYSTFCWWLQYILHTRDPRPRMLKKKKERQRHTLNDVSLFI